MRPPSTADVSTSSPLLEYLVLHQTIRRRDEADKGYTLADFVADCRALNVTSLLMIGMQALQRGPGDERSSTVKCSSLDSPGAQACSPPEKLPEHVVREQASALARKARVAKA
jgi:hypothetical protein